VLLLVPSVASKLPFSIRFIRLVSRRLGHVQAALIVQVVVLTPAVKRFCLRIRHDPSFLGGLAG
jgi:hypothetical protein